MLLNRTKMPKPYSIDLREKLFAQLDSGMSISKASKIFRVNRQTIYNWVSIKEETGKLEAKSGYKDEETLKLLYKKFIASKRANKLTDDRMCSLEDDKPEDKKPIIKQYHGFFDKIDAKNASDT